MAKVNIKSDKITPFEGIYYASKAFYALSPDKVINGTFGVRSSTYNGYQWNEMMSGIFRADCGYYFKVYQNGIYFYI